MQCLSLNDDAIVPTNNSDIRPDQSSHRAALLLMQVSKIATQELVPQTIASNADTAYRWIDDDDDDWDDDDSTTPRCRTVSFGSLDGVERAPRVREFVGATTAGSQIRGVLRKKFSWKHYPELEDYLVQNRAQYLQYSSQLNYTAEQKLYNNRLTKGLLELANEQGYVFEEFTFAAVRDRIRCYYKSCVQAAKKKRKRRK